MGISKRDLSQAYTDYYHKYGGNKEDYFPLLYISKEFRRPVEEVAHLVAFGGNDYGIDAFFIDRETRNLYLYQFKWAENHNLFKDSFKRIIDSGMERVFGNPIQDKNQNQLLLQLKAAIHESQSIIERVLIHFVFNGDPGAAEQSVVLDSLREDLESKKYLIDQYFSGRQITLTFQFISNQTKKLAVSHLKKTYQYDVKIPECIVAETHNDELMNIGFMPILIFYEMYRDMGLRLFERNIRAGLSSDRPANRALRRALNRIVLEEQDPPEIFAFNHNGVTLAVENCEKLNGIMKLTEPRILNGAQTVITLVRFMEENQGNKKLEKNIEFLNKMKVITKIISNASPEFIVGVTICNNRQNPVEPWHLRASDPIQLELQDKFREDLGIFYERLEDAFEALTDEDLMEMGIDQYKEIEIKRLAQTLLASQGEIDRVSRLRDVFENEKIYKNTFKESYLRTDSRKILFCYKMQFRINRIIREIIERGHDKYAYLSRAKNLVWGLLIQAVLNDDKLSFKLEQFGNTMGIESDYTEYLKDLASKRVRLIISEALDEDRYKKAIQEEKYSFLRTKSTFQKCMETAYNKYSWTKKSL